MKGYYRYSKTNVNLRWMMALSLLIVQCVFFACPVLAQDDDDEVTIIDTEGNEEEFIFPEAMDYDLDSLLSLYTSKTYLKVDDDCQMSDVNPTYTAEEYIERLRRMPTIMEMPYNEVVQIT